jgi:hypothetical protein
MEPDKLTAELDAIGRREKIAYASPRAMAESGADVPRLLAAFRLLLGVHARCTTADEYAAIMAALTGKEAGGG